MRKRQAFSLTTFMTLNCKWQLCSGRKFIQLIIIYWICTVSCWCFLKDKDHRSSSSRIFLYISKAILLSNTLKNRFLLHLPSINFQTVFCIKLSDVFIFKIRMPKSYTHPSHFPNFWPKGYRRVLSKNTKKFQHWFNSI